MLKVEGRGPIDSPLMPSRNFFRLMPRMVKLRNKYLDCTQRAQKLPGISTRVKKRRLRYKLPPINDEE